MHRLVWGRAALASVGLLSLLWGGCDDGDTGSTPETDMAGGQGGGGEGGDGGNADMDVDLGGMGGMGGAGGAEVCDCGPGCADALCIEAAPCNGDDTCRDGRICKDGSCVAGCVQPSECPPDQPICVEGRCGNCRTDDDCFGEATCGPLKTCVAPETCVSTRECVTGGVCDGDTGDCAAAFDCRVDGFACPGEFSCLADLGECAASSDACVSGDECVFGEVCVAGTQCGQCTNDNDCPGSSRCTVEAGQSRCVEPSECTGDLDCLGARICAGGVCSTPACPADAFSGNDTLASAAVLAGDVVHRGLFNCGADWYQLPVPTNVGVTIIVRQRDRGADLRLRVTTAEGRVLDTADGRGAVEAIVLAPVAGARSLRVVVDQTGPASVGAYDLEVFFSGGGVCLDDGYEVGAGDNTPDTGRVVRTQGAAGFGQPVSGRLCADNVDYVCFWLAPGENFRASVEVTGAGTVTGELFGELAPGTSLASGTWGGAAPSDLQAFSSGGRHCIRLASAANGLTWRLTMTAFTQAMDALCNAAAALPTDANGTGGLNAALARERDNATSPRCSASTATAGERAYSVTVDSPRLLTATVQGLGTGSLGDPVLSVRSACRLADTELGCATGSLDVGDPSVLRPNPARLRAALPAAGTYTVIVDGVDPGADPTFRLDVQTAGLAAPPANDTCESARALDLPAGVTDIEVNLDQATDAVVGCLGGGAPDAVWRVNLPTAARINAQVFSQPDEFAVGIYLTSRCGGLSPTACGYGFDQVVPAGEYFLVIDGANNNSRGRVQAHFEVTPIGPAAANDTCESAIALVGPSGTILGDTRGATDDYQLIDGNACTRHDSRGGDIVYRLPVVAGQPMFVNAVPTGGWDLSLFALPDCSNLGNRCVGSDGALEEAIVFTPQASGDLFIVVDGSAGESGAFDLRWGTPQCDRVNGGCAANQQCRRNLCVANP